MSNSSIRGLFPFCVGSTIAAIAIAPIVALTTHTFPIFTVTWGGINAVVAILGLILGWHKRVKIDHQLIGVRGFSLRSGGVLTAITGRDDWVRGTNEARCIGVTRRDANGNVIGTVALHNHNVPADGCHCGFNVHSSLADLRASGYAYSCTAVVEGWGRARLHRNGWRSQYARILAIVDEQATFEYVEHAIGGGTLYTGTDVIRHVPVRHRILLEAAALRYDVPIITAQQAEKGLDEFGTAVSESVQRLVR